MTQAVKILFGIFFFFQIPFIWALSCGSESNKYYSQGDYIDPMGLCLGGIPRSMDMSVNISQSWEVPWDMSLSIYNWKCDDTSGNIINCATHPISALAVSRLVLIGSTYNSRTYEVRYTYPVDYCAPVTALVVGNTIISSVSSPQLISSISPDICVYKFFLPTFTGSSSDCLGVVKFSSHQPYNFFPPDGSGPLNSFSSLDIINIPICGNTGTVSGGGGTGITVTLSGVSFLPPEKKIIDSSGSYLPLTYTDNVGNTYVHQSALYQLLAWVSIALTIVWLLFRFILRNIGLR